MPSKRRSKSPVKVTVEQLPVPEQLRDQVREELVQTLADIIRELGVRS